MTQPTAPNYTRPRVGWVKRRARTYMRACSLPRREAVRMASGDHFAFCHGNAAGLSSRTQEVMS